jgi:putative redox protein
MGTVDVRHEGGDRFSIEVRGHRLVVDQPVIDGGEDTAPTPTELFVASLGSCVAFYARRYLTRHQLPTHGLAVTANYTTDSRPARVDSIELDLTIPVGVSAERRHALLAVVSHCTVHNTLTDPPAVTISLADADASAA